MDDLGSELRQESHQVGVCNTVAVEEVNLALFNGFLVAPSFELFSAQLAELLVSNIGFGFVRVET